MSNNIKKEFKKSNIKANSDFDFYQLTRKSHYLLDCSVERSMDEVVFDFEIYEEKEFKEIKKASLTFQYQALLNIKYLYEDSQRVDISLNPDNLYYDFNMMPKAMLRDIYLEDKFEEMDFVQQYKSLIGYVFQNQYSFSDYYQGGNQLLEKNKMTKKYTDASTMEEVVNILEENYQELLNKLKESMVEVNKKKFKRLKWTHRLLLSFLVLSLVLGGYFGGFKLRQETRVNKANESYIQQDYVSVVEILKPMNIKRMNQNTKYILTVSNIKVESLNDEQKNNILSGVALSSDSRIFDFWIYLGKSDVESAIDIAKQLGNKEYLAYAYMKHKSKIENSQDISGSEREEKLKEINENLQSLELDKEVEESN